MNDAYDSVVTYIVWRYGIFSKALSGISLILFPPRNLKKKQYNLHLFYLFNLLTMKHLKINGFKKIVQLRSGVCVCAVSYTHLTLPTSDLV